MLRIKLLKLADRAAGGIAASLLTAQKHQKMPLPRRFLIIRPGGIGDAVLLVPALTALKKAYPQAVIAVLAEKRNAAAFALCPAVDQILLYDNPRDLAAVLAGGYDIVIDTEQWHRLSAVVARLCRAPFSIGFGTNDRSRLFSCAISYCHDNYELDSFFNLLAPLGIEPAENLPAPFLSVPQEAGRCADTLLEPLRGERLVAIFPGGSIAERRWGAGRFREVAAKLARFGLPIVVVGGGEDARDGEVIVGGAASGLNLAGKTSLPETAAVIQKSALLLSGDSGVLHIAVGLGRPTVSLFGPGIAAKWAPRGKEHTVLNRRLSCSPCTRFGTTPPCPFHARCMSEISIDEVAAAVIAELQAVSGAFCSQVAQELC